MFRNYLKIGFRALLRKKLYSFINILGLSIGMASSILILLWVYDEVTFDTGFSKYELLHQVKLNDPSDGKILTKENVPMPLKDVLLQQDSRIRRYAITVNQPALLSTGEKKISKRGIDASESFLEMFDFKLLKGDPETVLDDPRSIVLTQSTATALFGNEDPIHKTVQVKFETTEEFKVVGIMADLPSNTSFRFDFILPFAYFESTSPWIQYARDNWSNNAFQLFVELQPGVDKGSVDLSIRDLVKKNSKEKKEATLFLHPMSRWRLHNNFENGREAGGMIDYVNLFSAIAILILVMACINFMNLATARSEHRAREVGIRKSVGSSRKQLITQFIGESLLIAVIAFLVSIVLVELALPFYNELVSKQLELNYTSSFFWLFSLLFVSFTALLAGSYPAFYLSSFKAIKVLKGKVQVGRRASTPRQVMVALQFGFSIVLIIGTTVIYQQIQYLKNRETGYDRENLMMVWSTSDIEKNYKSLKQELLATNVVQAVCKSNIPITSAPVSSSIDTWTGMNPGQRVEVTNIATEYDYTRTMGIRMIEGRDFSEDFKSDTAAIILNEKTVEALSLEHPVGDKVQMWGQWWTIIGIMDDVLMGSTTVQIEPSVMTMDPTWSTTITIRLAKTRDLAAGIKQVEDVFKKYNPDYPFQYRFADEEFEKKFTSINMVSSLASSFAVLAIIITGLGLFGMSAFAAEQRMKEIGIRKVIGASVLSLIMLLVKDFSKIVLIAFLIFSPLAWWGMNEFLEQYQMRIAPPLWVFPAAGLFSLLITIMIAGTQALRAAVQNPVDSLKSE